MRELTLSVKKYAILIAVEEYSNPSIEGVRHAKRDAGEFSRALTLHGFDAGDQLILTNQQATKEVIASEIGRALKRLHKEDTLYFYYAGHAFSNAGESFLACYDTQDSELQETSIALAPLIKEIDASGCQKTALFLDCSERGMNAASGSRGLQEHDLKAYLEHARHCGCFVACRSGEKSHFSSHLQHGIWAHHVIEAFKGEAPLALEGGLLTAQSLQNYVKAEVPRTLRNEHPNPDEQTPWMVGTVGRDFVLADLRDIVEERRENSDWGNTLADKLSFTVADTEGLRSLSGWKKHYRIPERYTDAAGIFAAECAAGELKQDLDRVYDKLKEAFGFTRRDLKASEPSDGTGSIITPYFNYSVTVTLNRDEPDEVTWTRAVDAIKVPGQLSSTAFAEVFDGVFDTLELSLPTRIDIEDFIDAVEAAKIPGLAIKYDREATYCELQLERSAGTVTLTAKTLSIVHDRPKRAQQLIESFDTIRQLVQKHNVPLFPSTTPAKH